MNRHTTILLHVAVWAIMFLAPLTFLNHGNGVNPLHYLLSCTGTFIMMVVFYANYLWLTPHYFISGEKKVFWAVNIVLCVVGGIAMHTWMRYAHELIDDGTMPHHIPTAFEQTVFVLRDIFNLTIAAAIATTIQLSLRWYVSEDARLKAEAERTEAELKNLRSQINPHFLLNTLNNIYALTAFDTNKAQNAIQELSKMLRHMLYDNQEQMVDLKDEIQFIGNYVNLMKLRLPANVKVDFKSEIKSKAEVKVAPLIFISLIENAFKHGVSPTEPSFICIDICADQQQIVCNISNSNFPKNQQDRSGHGIGLHHVERRLALIYSPEQYHWEKGVSDDGKTYQSKIEIKQT